MDDTINFTLPPATLSQLCTAKIATTMLNSVLEDVAENKYFPRDDADDIKIRLLDNAQRVNVPHKLTPYLRKYLFFVLSEIRDWYQAFEQICYSAFVRNLMLTNEALAKIAWTGRGQIDRAMTARNYVTTGRLSLKTRYRVACVFYMEDMIHEFWRKMDLNFRDFNDYVFPAGFVKPVEVFDVFYWSYQIMEKLDDSVDYIEENYLHPHECVLEPYVNHFDLSERQRVDVYGLAQAIIQNNAHAIRHFAKKCPEFHKIAVYNMIGFSVDLHLFELGSDATFACLLSVIRMDIIQIIERTPEKICHEFKFLPSEIFARTFRDLKSAIAEEDFYRVLLTIADHKVSVVDNSPFDLNWGKVFRDIWLNEVPESYRTYVWNQTHNGDEGVAFLLRRFYDSNQFDNAKLLTRYQSEASRRAVLASVIKDVKIVQLFLDQSDPMAGLQCQYEKIEGLEDFSNIASFLVTSVDDLKYINRIVAKEVYDDERWKSVIRSLERSMSDE